MIKNKAFILQMSNWRLQRLSDLRHKVSYSGQGAEIFCWLRFYILQTNQLLTKSLQKNGYPNSPFTPSTLHKIFWSEFHLSNRFLYWKQSSFSFRVGGNPGHLWSSPNPSLGEWQDEQMWSSTTFQGFQVEEGFEILYYLQGGGANLYRIIETKFQFIN